MMQHHRLRQALMAVVLLIAGIAIGWMLPRDGREPPAGASAAAAPGRADARQVFSPDIRHDPYVVEEQRKLLGMIERQCRATGEHCAAAQSLRRSIEADERRSPRSAGGLGR